MTDKTQRSPKGAPKKPRKATPRASNAAYQKAFVKRQREAGLMKFQRWVKPEEAAMLADALAESRNETGDTK